MLVLGVVLPAAVWVKFGTRCGAGILAGMRDCLFEFSVAEERSVRASRPRHQHRQSTIGQRNRRAIPAALRVVGGGCVCYINQFPGEPERSVCGPVLARGGDRLRSGVRAVQQKSSGKFEPRDSPQNASATFHMPEQLWFTAIPESSVRRAGHCFPADASH